MENWERTDDLVRVVRCRDCAFSRELDRNDPTEGMFSEGWMWCTHDTDRTRRDGYCDEGERRGGTAEERFCAAYEAAAPDIQRAVRVLLGRE